MPSITHVHFHTNNKKEWRPCRPLLSCQRVPLQAHWHTQPHPTHHGLPACLSDGQMTVAEGHSLKWVSDCDRALSSHDGGKDSLEHDSDRWSEFTSERGDDTPRVSFDLPPGGQLEHF